MRSDNLETLTIAPDSSGLDANVSWFKYVRKYEALEWEACGWTITPALEGTHHGRHAVLCKWPHSSQPKMPKIYEDAICGDKTCYRGCYGLGQGYQFKDGPCDSPDCQWPKDRPTRPHFTDGPQYKIKEG